RSAFSTFTERAMKEVKTRVDSVLQSSGVKCKKEADRWKISKAREIIRLMKTQDRLLLLMNTVYDVFGNWQYLRGGSLQKIRSMVNPTKVDKREVAYVQLPKELK